jgi:hypothetical protein
MPEDYAAAAIRHFRDAGLLEQGHRIANADQLFGFAAECAIKRVLVEFPGFAADGKLSGAYHKHVDVLWNSVPVQSIQKRYPRLAALLRGLPQPFHDWSTANRYGPEGVTSIEAMNRHRQAAARILGSVGLTGTRAER